MNPGLWIARKNHLFTLMRKVAEAHGDFDMESIRQDCKEVIDVHPGEEIEKAIACYQEMVDQLKYLQRKK